jgi:SET family sugar efflux transporter-like MFS transporter
VPFLAVFAAVLLLGIADSMVNSYIVLFGADVAGLTPLQIGVWASVFAIGGITISWWLGRLFDRRPARTYAIVVILLGSAGYVLLPRVSSFLVLVLMAATVLGALGAAFPQLFALARSVLGEGAAGQRSALLLRLVRLLLFLHTTSLRLRISRPPIPSWPAQRPPDGNIFLSRCSGVGSRRWQ